VLDSYYEPVVAHLARTKLEAAGIPCFLTNENLVSLNRMYSPVAGGVRLHVYQRDAAQAAEVLREPPVMQAVPGGLAEPASLAAAATCLRLTRGAGRASKRGFVADNALGAAAALFFAGADAPLLQLRA
jgi:hypothetical protein